MHRSASRAVIDISTLSASEHLLNGPGFTLQTRGWEWRVRARFGDTFGDWSGTRAFAVEEEGTDCPPVITSVTPSPLTAGRQTITLNGSHMYQGTVTTSSPSGRTARWTTFQELSAGQYVVRVAIAFDEAGEWSLRLKTNYDATSNEFRLSVR